MQKAFFFDRDGTINVDRHYLFQKEEFEFLPGVPQVLRELRHRGYLLILITNQSGIARGFYTVEQMQELHQYMQGELAKYGAQFDDILFCPHHPEGRIPQYSVGCKCRKPGRLLFEKAIEKYGIKAGLSYAVGDRERDLLPAEELGIKCIIISDKGGSRWHNCPSMAQLINYI